jgi:DNA polymerase III chi subunit, HolC
MGVVMFYHLTRSSTADTVQSLVSRALAQGWRVMIRGTDHAALDRLDARLWLGPDDDFVPHGLQGGPLDADQPVLIGQGGVANGAQALPPHLMRSRPWNGSGFCSTAPMRPAFTPPAFSGKLSPAPGSRRNIGPKTAVGGKRRRHPALHQGRESVSKRLTIFGNYSNINILPLVSHVIRPILGPYWRKIIRFSAISTLNCPR